MTTMADEILSTITITKSSTTDGLYVFVDTATHDGEDIELVDALGMIELAKDTLIRVTKGEFE